MKRHFPLLIVPVLPLLFAGPCLAWWPAGHSLLGGAAVRALPTADKDGAQAGNAMPRFFRSGWKTIAHCAQDPDVFKNRDTPLLSDREAPEHYIDWEALGGRALPEKRSEFVALCAREKLDPEDIGYLPYAVAEGVERLTIAFAEHRKWPNNEHIRLKCLVYAGNLAHYGGDLEMPLHVTIDHDGRAKPNGESPRSGIHARLDSLIEKLAEKKQLDVKALAGNQPVTPLAGPLLKAVLDEIARSRTHIDRAYELEALLPPSKTEEKWTPDPKIVAFGNERGSAATRFIASLYLTAWRNSADIKLPDWLVREAVR